jgi:hypothetical protein
MATVIAEGSNCSPIVAARAPSAAKTRPLPGAARPQASKPAATAPRIQPRAAPLPTPAPGGGNKRMMYVLLFVGVAFGLAAVVAKIVLKLF